MAKDQGLLTFSWILPSQIQFLNSQRFTDGGLAVTILTLTTLLLITVRAVEMLIIYQNPVWYVSINFPPKTNYTIIAECSEFLSSIEFVLNHDRIITVGDFNVHINDPSYNLLLNSNTLLVHSIWCSMSSVQLITGAKPEQNPCFYCRPDYKLSLIDKPFSPIINAIQKWTLSSHILITSLIQSIAD